MRILAGPRITMVGGPISRTMAGSGSREATSTGDRPGCRGEPVAITSAGRLCRRAGPGVVYEGQPIGGNVDITFDIGPEYYNFCDVRFIGEPVLRDRIFPRAQNVTYITNTVNVTNITVQNNVVYNYGPNYNVVNQYSSRPIQRLTIERETPGNLSDAVKSGTLTKVQGNKLLVAAPARLAKAPPT